MRVVFLSPSGELGGAETALVDMLAALGAARPDWTLSMIAAADGPLVPRAAPLARSTALPFPRALARLGEWGARTTAAGRFGLAASLLKAAPSALAYAAQLGRALHALQPDIVHSNGLKMHLLAARAVPPASKLVWHFHDYTAPRRLTARLLASQTRRCDVMLANSKSVAADVRAALGATVPVHAVYNAVDLDRFSPQGAALDLDALAGLPAPPPGTIRIGLIATFARWKGHPVFLDALARLRGRVPVRGYIVGDAIYQTDASQFSRRELEAQARARGVGDAVAFTGRVDDVPGALRALDIAVHASVEPEPFGLAIAEAMACGRPVAVSRAGGAEEIAVAGAALYEPGHAAELADRLEELAGDPARRAALGAAGRSAAERLFGRAQLSAALIPVYEALASSPRS